jgi:hypothetical protein
MRERAELGVAVVAVFGLWLAAQGRAPPTGTPLTAIGTFAKKERSLNFSG